MRECFRVRAGSEQRLKQILLLAKAIKSKMRNAVYCERPKTSRRGEIKKRIGLSVLFFIYLAKDSNADIMPIEKQL
jgi:hypothetical protein